MSQHPMLSRRLILGSTTAVTFAELLGAEDATAQAPRRGGKLTIAQHYPNFAQGQSTQGQHPYFWIDVSTRSVWNCLTWVDETYVVRPELATAWESDAEARVWEFTLRDDVVFHDGRPMTVDDVVTSMTFHARGGVGLMGRGTVARVEAVGSNKVRFHLGAPNAEFPFILSEFRAVVLPKAEPDRIGYDGIGTGPFRIASVDTRRGARLERHERYYDTGRPHVDEMEILLVNAQAGINGFRSGQFDVALNIDPAAADQYRSVPGADITQSVAGDLTVIVLPKVEGSPFNDVRVRRAFARAIDRVAINRIVFRDPRGWVGNDSHVSGVDANFLPGPARDVPLARRLLAEAGFPNGLRLPTIYVTTGFPEEPRIWPIIAESVREAGIQVTFEERPFDGFFPWVAGPPLRPYRALVGARNTGISLLRFTPENQEHGLWRGEATERYVALYRQALGTVDPDARRALYHEMQRLLAEEVPGIVAYGRRNLLAHQRHVHGLQAHSQHWCVRYEGIWRSA